MGHWAAHLKQLSSINLEINMIISKAVFDGCFYENTTANLGIHWITSVDDFCLLLAICSVLSSTNADGLRGSFFFFF
jgi:hypothetical protein